MPRSERMTLTKCVQDESRRGSDAVEMRSCHVSLIVNARTSRTAYLHVDMRDVANNIVMVINNRNRADAFALNDEQSVSDRLIATSGWSVFGVQLYLVHDSLDGNDGRFAERQVTQAPRIQRVGRSDVLPEETHQTELGQDSNHFVGARLCNDDAVDARAKDLDGAGQADSMIEECGCFFAAHEIADVGERDGLVTCCSIDD